jgi:hypothetical protein
MEGADPKQIPQLKIAITSKTKISPPSLLEGPNESQR